MTTAKLCIIIAIAVYLIAMVAVGVFYSGRGGGSNSGEFYLGGRKLGPIVTAMSAEASDMSSYLLMGLPGLAYIAGVAEVGWTIIGLAAGTYLNWLITAKRLRNYSAHMGAITIPDFFSRRFRDEKKVLSCIAAAIILIFFIPYTASGFKAIGTLFNSLFGVNYHGAMIVGAIVVIGYTVLGGFLAVSTTDLIQSIVMTFALIFIVFFAIHMAGGWDTVTANAAQLPGYLNLTQGYDAATGTAASYPPLVILSTMAWGLGYFGMPHILLRFMAIEDAKKLSLSRRVATIWVFIAMGVAILIGVVGSAMISNGSIAPLAPGDSQRIIIKIAELLGSHGVLAALVAGVILSGILAATMSTADSQLLAAASSVTQDLLGDTLKVKLSDKAAMIIARAAVLVIGIIAIVWARAEGSVFTIVSFAWAGFGAAFGPTMLLALFWKRSTKAGAIAGMLAGGVMVFVWKYLVRPLGGILDIYELLPAFLCGILVNVLASLASQKAEAEALRQIEKEFTSAASGES